MTLEVRVTRARPGTLVCRRVTAHAQVHLEHLERLLELQRAELGPGDVEMYVEVESPAPLLTITMCQVQE